MTMVLLASDMQGYSNLCQLVTLRQLGTTKLAQNAAPAEADGRPVTLQELSEHGRDVIALCPLPTQRQDTSNRRGTIVSGTSHQSRVTSHQSPVTSHFSRLKDIFGDRLYVEVQHLSPGDRSDSSRVIGDWRLVIVDWCKRQP